MGEALTVKTGSIWLVTANINRGKSNYLKVIYSHYHLMRDWPTIVFTKQEGNKQLRGLHDMFPDHKELYIKTHDRLQEELDLFLSRVAPELPKTIIVDDITFSSHLKVPDIVTLGTRVNEHNAILVCTCHTVTQGRENNQILRLMENATWWSLGLHNSLDLEDSFKKFRLSPAIRPSFEDAIVKVKRHGETEGLKYPYITHHRGTSNFYNTLFEKVSAKS